MRLMQDEPHPRETLQLQVPGECIKGSGLDEAQGSGLRAQGQEVRV